MNIVPVLPAPLAPPTKAMVWSTSGSSLTIWFSFSCARRIAPDEMSCEASENPDSMPVSCCGKSPFGTLIASSTVRPSVEMVRSSMSSAWRSTQRSARS